MGINGRHDSGTALAPLQWLLAHHEAKLFFRREVVKRWCLGSDARFVDLGCGPGLWTNNIVEEIAPGVHLHRLDVAHDSIGYARQESEKLNISNALFEIANISDPPDALQRADVELTLNILGYLADPIRVLRRIWQRLKPCTRFIVRQFDNGATIFSGVDAALQARIYASVFTGIQGPSPAAGNPLFGRDLIKIYATTDIPSGDVRTDAAQICTPLTEGTRSYIGAKAQWFAGLASRHATPEDLRAWRSLLPFDGQGGAFEEGDFYFTTLDVQLEATKHAR
jgi:SAM-dependent methyltransferase